MQQARLADIRACVFDAYGTLFDFASAARACRDDLGDKVDTLTALWRDKQLQYTWLRAAQGRHADFWQVTGDALDFVLESMGLERPGLRERLMECYLTLAPFPEVPGVLQTLKGSGMRTAVLSNGSPRMLSAAVEGAKLDGLLDAVLSVEEAGVYKPHPKVYQLAVDRLGVRGRIDRVPVVQCLGCPRGVGLRHEGGLVQPLRPEARAAAGRPRPRGEVARRTARAGGCGRRLNCRCRTRICLLRGLTRQSISLNDVVWSRYADRAPARAACSLPIGHAWWIRMFLSSVPARPA